MIVTGFLFTSLSLADIIRLLSAFSRLFEHAIFVKTQDRLQIQSKFIRLSNVYLLTFKYPQRGCFIISFRVREMGYNYKIQMEKIKVTLTKDCIITKQISVELNANLAWKIVKDEKIIEFLNRNQVLEGSQHIIQPLSLVKQDDQWIIIYNRFGTALASLPEDDLLQIATLDFVKQLAFLYIQLSDLRPTINKENVFVYQKQAFKVLLQDTINQEEYLASFKKLVKQICKGKKQILQKIKEITHLDELKSIYSQQKQGKTISKLSQLKFNNIKHQYKIFIEQTDIEWIFHSLGFPAVPKYDLIYNGLHHNFDPVPMLKAIAKNHVFFLIETTRGNKIAFYPAVRYQSNPTSLFGGYLSDKQKKSMILGLKNHSIHQLQEQQYAVGFGPQLLLSIGKVDIVLSAFNISNMSYFPVSYKADEKAYTSNPQDLLGSTFTLKQFQVYRIS